MRQRGAPLLVTDIGDRGDSQVLSPPGADLFVNTRRTGNGSGYTYEKAFNDMEDAFEWIDKQASGTDLKSNGTIHFLGDVRKELVAPLGAHSWKIRGEARGRPRHSTDGGVLIPNNGASWREPASGATTGGALITLRQQGWELENFTIVPKSDGTAIRFRRAESATYPDASHGAVRRVRIMGGAASSQIGIEDHGGCSDVIIDDCDFEGLTYGMKSTVGAGIDSPNRYQVSRSRFGLGAVNTNHILFLCYASIIGGDHGKGNFFGRSTTKMIETFGGVSGKNWVINNYLADAEADIDNAHGYKGAADDTWRNFSNNVAAMYPGVPGA